MKNNAFPKLDQAIILMAIYERIKMYKPLRKDLLKFLEKEFGGEDGKNGISDRNLLRLLDRLMDDFLIPIQESKNKSGEKSYFIDPAQQADGDIKLLEGILYFGNLFKKAKGKFNHPNGLYLDLELSFTKYQARITECLEAIRSGKVIEITHQGFEYDAAVNQAIIPYFVIERDKHWYLVGRKEEGLAWRTFGLDRMVGVVSTSSRAANKDETISENELFSNLLGVSLLGEAPSPIKLKFTAWQAKYQRNYPWHHSFEELERTDDYSIVGYNLVINFELKMKIKALGTAVKVLEPHWLMDEIREELKATLELYM